MSKQFHLFSKKRSYVGDMGALFWERVDFQAVNDTKCVVDNIFLSPVASLLSLLLCDVVVEIML